MSIEVVGFHDCRVGARMTSRTDGVSSPPFGPFNLATHVGDDPAAVLANRQHLKQMLGVVAPVYLNQVHGTKVVELVPGATDGAVADAAWTRFPNLACTVMVADCLPVLLADVRARWVAAVHVGWRGLVGQGGHGAIEAVFEALRQAFGDGFSTAETTAWLGPCIGPDHFEVGSDVVDALALANFSLTQETCRRVDVQAGKWLVNLSQLARNRLHELGCTQVFGNDGGLAWCTHTQFEQFFSYRRSRVTGRMAALVWLNAA